MCYLSLWFASLPEQWRFTFLEVPKGSEEPIKIHSICFDMIICITYFYII